MYSQDLSVVVLDVGSLTTRAGWAGEDTPKFVCPSYVGKLNCNMEIEDIQKSSQYVCGDSKLNALKNRIEVQQVFNQGKVLDFELYETLVKNILENDMRFNFEEYSFLLSQSNTHNRAQREKLAQIFYQGLNIKNLYFCKNAVLSCFATGRSTALVLDSGASMTEATTVHDGFVLSKSNRISQYGGETLTQELQNYLERQLNVNLNYRPMDTASSVLYQKRQLLRNIKEYVYKIDQSNPDNNIVQCELPDHQVIKIDKSRVPDPFFTNFSAEPNYKGLHSLINENISLCDIDIKKQLSNNIIITGGNSLLGGFAQKFQSKLAELTSPQKAKFISFPFPSQRKFSTWIGGSVLASVASFQSFWVGKQEWTESGISILQRKCA